MKQRLFAIAMVLLLLLPSLSISSSAENESKGSVLILTENPIPDFVIVPESINGYEKSGLTLADISLPEGWEWNDPTLSPVNGTSYLAVYSAPNVARDSIKANIKVNITECMHSECSEWVHNNDHTFLKDGTKTRVCLYCDEEETVINIDSSIHARILNRLKEIFEMLFSVFTN